MYNSQRKIFLFTAVCGLMLSSGGAWAADTPVVSVNTATLPINVAGEQPNTPNAQASGSVALVSPSQAQAVEPAKQPTNAPEVKQQTPNEPTQTAAVSPAQPAAQGSEENADFDFDLKLKSVNAVAAAAAQPAPSAQVPPEAAAPQENPAPALSDADMPKTIQYTANPIENLGNSVLSEMDSDLFSQMSEIEKSVTLLTLELRREKIRNEIEAQKAIRQKASVDFERQKAEDKLKILEKQKQIEAQVVKEKQLLMDKEKLFEVLRQRKLLNAYMNHMLEIQQEWLKEKETLYNKIAAVEQEKRDMVVLFKQKIDKVLEASAQNIQTAEAARANFERIIKGLKARNDQLRKRVEADAQIIKNAKSNLYLKSPSIEELKDRVAVANTPVTPEVEPQIEIKELAVDDTADQTSKLSAEYAILGISGRAGVMSIDLIDVNGQPLTLKIGSPLPTGHVVSEIGSDFAKFTRDGQDDYLYVGQTIDGIVPTLGLNTDTKTK